MSNLLVHLNTDILLKTGKVCVTLRAKVLNDNKAILQFSTFYSTAVVGRLGFKVGVSASYSYFCLSLNKRERLSPRY